MAEIARRDVFQAIADPTRRQIIELLSERPMNLNALAGNFEISRPAISQHIKVLSECGLIEIETRGRERYCKIRPEELVPAFMWLEQYHKQWMARIDAFENYVNALHKKNKKQKNRNHGKRKK